MNHPETDEFMTIYFADYFILFICSSEKDKRVQDDKVCC